MSEVQSWQIQCRRCGWANSGAELRCMKCGRPLPHRPGMLVAGQSAGAAARAVPAVKIAQPAGFWVRLVALLLDSVFLFVILAVVTIAWVAMLTPTHIDPKDPARSLIAAQTLQLLALNLALVIVTTLYFVGSMSILGATPMMRLFNLHIVNAQGGPIGFGRALLRWLFSFSAYAVMILLANVPLVFTLAGLALVVFAVIETAMVAASKSKRALHDRLAGTLVIQYLDPDKIRVDPAGAATVSDPPPTPQPAPDLAPPPQPVPPVPAAAATGTPMATGAPVVAQPPPVTPPPPTPIPGPSADPLPAASPFLAPPPLPAWPAMAPALYSPPAPSATPEPPAGREVYSPAQGQVPAPVTLDPYPLPFTPAPTVDIPAEASPPHPHPGASEPPPA